ncbi:MAG TPA: VOC family protein [Acidimicrobiales bacterium]|nr:VOC family protein [Acidimicrobiales bacterium]
MDNLNHVKIVTPDPTAVDHFLQEVLEIPAGWSIGEPGPPAHPPAPAATSLDDEGRLVWENVGAWAQSWSAGGVRGYIAGSPRSRQFQIFEGPKAHIWAVAVGTRHLEQAHQRCEEQGIACTEMRVVAWGDGYVRAFFAEVGGIIFEVLRVEPAPEPAG